MSSKILEVDLGDSHTFNSLRNYTKQTSRNIGTETYQEYCINLSTNDSKNTNPCLIANSSAEYRRNSQRLTISTSIHSTSTDDCFRFTSICRVHFILVSLFWLVCFGVISDCRNGFHLTMNHDQSKRRNSIWSVMVDWIDGKLSVAGISEVSNQDFHWAFAYIDSHSLSKWLCKLH